MIVKALVLWDPWAWLIRLKLKEYETRGWGTSYQGPLLICAAKRPVNRADLIGINHILRHYGHERISIDDLRPGHAVALGDLMEDIRIQWNVAGYLKVPENLSPMERLFGNFSRNRHALKLENVKAIEPFPVKGRQGLFEVEIPEELLA